MQEEKYNLIIITGWCDDSYDWPIIIKTYDLFTMKGYNKRIRSVAQS